MDSTIINKPTYKPAAQSREYLIFGICLLCVFLSLFSAYEKLAEHQVFANGLSKVAVIGTYAEFIAWMVPFAEIGVSLLMIIPATYKLGLYGFTALMVIFTTYMMVMLIWNKALPCHCNLIIDQLSWTQHVWFNLFFIGLAVTAICLGRSTPNIHPNYKHYEQS
jgi:hypothetical protein